jgi:hypothetical protein
VDGRERQSVAVPHAPCTRFQGYTGGFPPKSAHQLYGFASALVAKAGAPPSRPARGGAHDTEMDCPSSSVVTNPGALINWGAEVLLLFCLPSKLPMWTYILGTDNPHARKQKSDWWADVGVCIPLDQQSHTVLRAAGEYRARNSRTPLALHQRQISSQPRSPHTLNPLNFTLERPLQQSRSAPGLQSHQR